MTIKKLHKNCVITIYFDGYCVHEKKLEIVSSIKIRDKILLDEKRYVKHWTCEEKIPQSGICPAPYATRGKQIFL